MRFTTTFHAPQACLPARPSALDVAQVAVRAIGRACPRCTCVAHRVARHWPDRLLSLVMPVARYRCPAPGCGWEGLLQRRRDLRLPPHRPAPAPARAGRSAMPVRGRGLAG